MHADFWDSPKQRTLVQGRISEYRAVLVMELPGYLMITFIGSIFNKSCLVYLSKAVVPHLFVLQARWLMPGLSVGWKRLAGQVWWKHYLSAYGGPAPMWHCGVGG